MAQARSHTGAGTFVGFLLGAVFILALLIGWAAWSGVMPGLPRQAMNVEVELPKAPKLPATPNPEPLPAPIPSRPG